MRLALVLAALALATPADAACRRFSVWHYPWAQHCSVSRATPARPARFVALARPAPAPDASLAASIPVAPDIERQKALQTLRRELDDLAVRP